MHAISALVSRHRIGLLRTGRCCERLHRPNSGIALQADVDGRSLISQSPFQALQAQNGGGADGPGPLPGSFSDLEAEQQQGQVDWAALSKISELQQLQLSDQLRVLEAQVSAGREPLKLGCGLLILQATSCTKDSLALCTPLRVIALPRKKELPKLHGQQSKVVIACHQPTRDLAFILIMPPSCRGDWSIRSLFLLSLLRRKRVAGLHCPMSSPSDPPWKWSLTCRMRGAKSSERLPSSAWPLEVSSPHF